MLEVDVKYFDRPKKPYCHAGISHLEWTIEMSVLSSLAPHASVFDHAGRLVTRGELGKIVWELIEIQKDRDNDITCWKLKATSESCDRWTGRLPNLRDHTMTIFND